MMNNGRSLKMPPLLMIMGILVMKEKNESHFQLGCKNQEARKNKTCQGEG
jgi:hypothetical protein